ncbi:MAG: LmeA family phospholipid-binding protein [Nitriliruptorales bacterium]|nr:LmeA family phospholipid-binding protein [Nitriliruptorales bacterium]
MSPVALLVALGIALVGAELALRFAAARIADQYLSRVIGADVRISLRGPFAGLRILTGRAEEVDGVASDVPILEGDALIGHLEVRLLDVELSLGERRLRAVHGEFTARIPERELDALAGVPSAVGSITIEDGALKLVTPAGVGVTADVEAEDGDLVVKPTNPIAELARFRLRFSVGELPAGATIHSVGVEGGEVVVRGDLDGSRLTD